MSDTKNQTEKKGRGRPPLSPEEKELRRIEYNRRSNEHHKKTGYVAQKKYKGTHPEVYDFYQPKVNIDKQYVDVLKSLVEKNQMTISEFFVDAVEKVYGVALSKKDWQNK